MKNLLPSLKKVNNHEVVIIKQGDGRYELGALTSAMELTNDDIFLLQDSCEIKDPKIFDIAAAHKGGMALNPRFEMYLGKYSRQVLEQMEIPIPRTKAEAVSYESAWNEKYIKLDKGFTVFHQPLHDNHIFEDKFGRTNMILENDYIKKYKGTWSHEMITESM